MTSFEIGIAPPGQDLDRRGAVSQFEHALTGQLLAHNDRHAVAVSPDGRRIAYVALAPNPGALSRIYIKSLDQWDPVAIPGTEGGLDPFFSPDGQWLGFVQGQQLMKVALAGGKPTALANIARPPAGGNLGFGTQGFSWGRTGAIVFSQGAGLGLTAVRDTGGEPTEFTQLDTASNEVSHRLPHFLPDGSAVLFTVLRYTTVTPN